MYIYVHFQRSAPWNIYCCDAAAPIRLLVYTGLAGWRACAHARSKGVVCNTRASSSAYFFLRFNSALHPPSPPVYVLLTPEALHWRRPSPYIKSCQGTVFSLSTVVKNRCKPRRGTKLKATLRGCVFARKTWMLIDITR